MKITTTYENFASAISSLKAAVTDKMAAETLRNVIFIVKPDDTVMLAAYNTLVTCFAPLGITDIARDEGQDGQDVYFQMKSDLFKVLDNFKTLNYTRVDKIEITPSDSNVLLEVSEVAADAIMDDIEVPDAVKASYSQVSQYRIPAPKLASGIRKEIENRDMSLTGEPMTAVDLKAYLDTLIATLPADAKDTVSTRIMLSGTDIYTAPQLFFAIMENKLPEVFRDFVLSSSAANFIRSYLDSNPDFMFSKETTANVVVLKFASERSVAFVNALIPKGLYDCTRYKTHSSTGFAVNKAYFCDLLQRVGSNDACSVTIRIHENGSACGTITSKSSRQKFSALVSRFVVADWESSPLVKSDEKGKYLEIAFSIRHDLLKKLLFAGVNDNSAVYMYFEQGAAPSSVSLAACDESGVWITKINSLSPKRNDFEWEV